MAEELLQQLERVRSLSVESCRPLTVEDHGLQAMPETSPPKWHLAHTTWFFETFVLPEVQTGYRPYREDFALGGLGIPRIETALYKRLPVVRFFDRGA